ncbi:soluble guanylate cyclase 88E-like [Anneissia japonica]|uniref:soluble guanylate cyclase 88E-like n=1 Tax=Anneissia japonica TaxID=1529436 RepID=UPI001425B98B|nr:soluble guanylate cyclase 88E-like [Anneissia japonica]
MYGLILESILEMIKDHYGEEKWLEIRSKADIDEYNFVTHDIYSERVVRQLSEAASKVLGLTVAELMNASGIYFVSFMAKYDYDRLLRCLGRTMSDFLNGLDNLHEYIRFSYPKGRTPSFFCTDETEKGLTLHYRSKRRGFIHYVIGQIVQIGQNFYDVEIDVQVVSSEYKSGMQSVVYRLNFENNNYSKNLGIVSRFMEKASSLQPSHIFKIFPFHIVFDDSMTIQNVGNVLETAMPYLVGKPIDQEFELVRPLVDFCWESVISHINNVFELAATTLTRRQTKVNRPSKSSSQSSKRNTSRTSIQCDESYLDALTVDVNPCRIRLKGQMKYIREWDAIIFLCTPVMENIDAMAAAGLYVNDFSIHDSSRDLILAGTQKSTELKMALDQEQRKSAELEESMRKLDVEVKKTDSLLYQMIPKPVAEKLRKGDSATSTCEVFQCVTILFSDVVGFTTICSRITPMAVVAMLNSMYTKFDNLCEAYDVYKVETIGDAYMIVSGAPTPTHDHVLRVSEMALSMIDAMHDLKEPDTDEHMTIRAGMHSGVVVAGVVGLKMPRYCLFGDTVNTASRMESTSEGQRIHISQATKDVLSTCPYVIEERGSIEVKGKGSMKTYWLKGRRDDAPPFTCFKKLGHHDSDDPDLEEASPYQSVQKPAPLQKAKPSKPQPVKTDFVLGNRYQNLPNTKPIEKKEFKSSLEKKDKVQKISKKPGTTNNQKNHVKSPVGDNMTKLINSPLNNQLKSPFKSGKKIENRQNLSSLPQPLSTTPIEKLSEPNADKLGSPINKTVNTSAMKIESEIQGANQVEDKPECAINAGDEEKTLLGEEGRTSTKCSRLCTFL